MRGCRSRIALRFIRATMATACWLQRNKVWFDNVPTLQFLTRVVLVASAFLCFACGRLLMADATINDRDLADARQVIETIAASPERTRLYCDWFRKQERMVEALGGGSRRPEELRAIAEASQAAFKKLGPDFAKAHEVSGLAFFRKDERARSLNDASSALTGKCAGGSV